MPGVSYSSLQLPKNFREKLDVSQTIARSVIAAEISPLPGMLPEAYRQESAADWVDWIEAIAEAIGPYVCMFTLKLAPWTIDGGGIVRLTMAVKHLRTRFPSTIILLDATYADNGESRFSNAKFAFEKLGVDAVTFSPYYGQGVLQGFAGYEGKGLVASCLSDNSVAYNDDENGCPHKDVQGTLLMNGRELWHEAARWVSQWEDLLPKDSGNVVCIGVGATTKPEYIEHLINIREEMPQSLLVVSGMPPDSSPEFENAVRGAWKNRGSAVFCFGDIAFASKKADFAEAAEALVQARRLAVKKALL